MREELHWLPMQKRIEFKILMLMRNCLAGQAPVYLREQCVPVLSIPGRRFLRSATQGDLVVPVARTSMVLHKSFAVVGPSFWNRLPSNLRNELLGLSLPLFRRRLKTSLFDRGLCCQVGSASEEYFWEWRYINLRIRLRLRMKETESGF